MFWSRLRFLSMTLIATGLMAGQGGCLHLDEDGGQNDNQNNTATNNDATVPDAGLDAGGNTNTNGNLNTNTNGNLNTNTNGNFNTNTNGNLNTNTNGNFNGNFHAHDGEWPDEPDEPDEPARLDPPAAGPHDARDRFDPLDEGAEPRLPDRGGPAPEGGW